MDYTRTMKSYSWDQYKRASSGESATIPQQKDCETQLEEGDYELVASHFVFSKSAKADGVHLIGALEGDPTRIAWLWVPRWQNRVNFQEVLQKARDKGDKVRLRFKVTKGKIPMPIVEDAVVLPNT